MNRVREAEQFLADYFDRKHCILCGRGATALWAIYQSLPPKKSKVILPATLCLSPALTLYYADKIPLFIDIGRDGNLDPDKVEQAFSKHTDIAAVLAVHLYGNPAKLERLADLCRKHDALLIEDAAQALGGKDKEGHLFGNQGEVAILSFGHSKILDLGSGGAILTDNTALMELFRSALNQVEATHSPGLAQEYSRLFYPIWTAGRTDRRFFCLFHPFKDLFKPLFFKQLDDTLADRIIESMPKLEALVAQRHKIANQYFANLSAHPKIQLIQMPNIGVPWRFILLVAPEARDPLLTFLRQQGYDASSWYPCIADWFEGNCTNPEQEFPIALAQEKRIINLWVTANYQGKKAEQLSLAILNFLTSFSLRNKAINPV